MGSSPAGAALQGPPGPIDPDTQFPSFYTDSNALSLEPCLDGPPLCLTTRADLLNSGADGEGFYYSAQAVAGGIDLALDLEAAYAGDGAGQEIVFARTQYSARGGGLVRNGTYTVTDPYGSRTCTANGAGAIPNNGCRLDEGGAVGGDFAGALGGRIGPFLTWDTLGAAAGAPPAGYIGDGATEHRVTGSPTGFNMFRVQGPGIDSTCPDGAGGEIPNCDQTDLFVVFGKIAPGAAATVTPGSHDFGNRAGATTQGISYSSIGTLNATVSSVATSGPFTATGCAGSTVTPGSACTITVTFNPVAGQSSTGALTITDNTGPGGAARSRSIPLAGQSVPVATSGTSNLAFGDRNVTAGASPAQDITLSNTGAAPLHVTAATPSNPAYAASVTGCATVAVGASCTLPVTFDPSTVGPANGSIALTTDGGNRTVPVTGRGVQSGLASDNQVSFGTVAVGKAKHLVLTVTNDGTAPLVLSGTTLGGNSDYALEDPGARECQVGTAVPVGGACDIGVAFTPGALGGRTGTLTLSRSDGASRVVALAGSGVDGVRPVVESRSPAPGATAVRPTGTVTVTFSEAVTGVRRTTFELVNGATGRPVRASIRAASARRYVLTPSRALPRGTSFTVRLVGGPSAIRDLAGLTLRNTSWRFRTR